LEPLPENTTRSCCCDVEPDVTQDLDFLRTVASYVVRDVPKRVTINTKRIYMAGHSNGCMMALAMAMTHSDLVASVCCHSGTLRTPPANDYTPVPVMLLHGTADDVVQYDGFGNEESEWFSPGIVSVFDTLSDINGCDGNVQTEEVAGGNVSTSTNCTNDATVKLLSLEGQGHQPYVGRTTEKAWEFCSAQEKSVEPVLDDISNSRSNLLEKVVRLFD